jgi:glycosyltransferase involved in cell wall biosynthesis
MKLTFIMAADLRTGRGTENVLFNLLKYKPDNIDITVVYPDFSLSKFIYNEEQVKEFTKDIKTIKFHLNKPLRFKNRTVEDLFNQIIFKRYYKALTWIKKNRLYDKINDTDIVYLFNNYYSIFIYRNIPLIGSFHTFDIETFMNYKKNSIIHNIHRKYIINKYFKNINGYHYLNDTNVFFNNNLKYKMVLKSGIDTDLFYPDNASNKKIKFLFVASLSLEKGLDILLPLIDMFVNNANMEFHIAGIGPMEEEIKARKNIIYHGRLDNSNLAKLYRESDIFIYPSHADAHPAVVLQALASGLYVLCSDYFKGTFDDFENKYLEYVPRNIESFYKRVNEIIEDRNIINHNKTEEFNYVKSIYDWPVIAKKFYEYMFEFDKENKLSNEN